MTETNNRASGWGVASAKLTATVRALPRVGIHRWPITLWPTPTRLHTSGTKITIAEEHGGFAFGGNKVRQVDVLLGAARELGAETVVTSAGPQSNLCRVVAAGARATGMNVHLLLRGQPPESLTQNQVLYELTGAELHWLDVTDPFDTTQSHRMESIAAQVHASGGECAVIDVREPPGSVKCTLAATEIVEDLAAQCAAPDRIVLAASVGNTAGGILANLAARGAEVGLVAVSASSSAERLRALILDRARAALTSAGLSSELADQVPLEVTDAFLGAGHGMATPEALAAQRQTATHCGSYLDTTYTAKAMAALLADHRPGHVVFLHTGGGPTVFTPRPMPTFTETTDPTAPSPAQLM